MASAANFARALTYAGALPFIAATAMVFIAPAAQEAVFGKLLITYAVVIASFLGGIQWGVALEHSESAPTSARNLFFISVIPSLFAWAMLFIPSFSAQLLAATTLFASIWALDALLALQKLIPGWFFKLRCIITGIVILCLMSAYFKAMFNAVAIKS
jgi:hypothetical protein